MATIDQIRALVDDPEGSTQIFGQDHYQTIIGIEDNVYRAAATACKTLAAHFAAKVAVTAGPVKIETQQKADRYLKLADSYDQRAREGGGSGADEGAMSPSLSGVSVSAMQNLDDDSDRVKGVFSIGQDDNVPEDNLN